MKETTIPRLELSAAVVATRLDKMIRAEIDTPVDSSWERLEKFMAWILRYRTNLRLASFRRRNGITGTQDKLKIEAITKIIQAENEVVRYKTRCEIEV